MSGSSVITDCKGITNPSDGGGVYVSGQFVMKNGSIKSCDADFGDGGGVYVNGSGLFSFEGGKISSCTAQHGGGVYNLKIFNMKGGRIERCSAKGNGGGVYNMNAGGVFSMEVVDNEDNITTIKDCTAKGQGNCVYNTNYYTINGGNIIDSSKSGYAVYNYKTNDGLTFMFYAGSICGEIYTDNDLEGKLKYCIVTFMNGSNVYLTAKVAGGEVINPSKPTAPQGQIFDAWYVTGIDGEEEWNFEYSDIKDYESKTNDPNVTTMTLNAKFATAYSITLPTGEGYKVEPESSKYSSPVKSGGKYIFKVNILEGWKKGADFVVKANGSTLTLNKYGSYTISNITSSQTITVDGVERDHVHDWSKTWTKNKDYHWHTCTASGCKITSPSDMDGYGIHVYDNISDSSCNDCEFECTMYTVSWNTNGGDAYSADDAVTSVAANSHITEPITDPTKDNCVFEGWYKDSALTTKWKFDSDTIKGNTVLYAKWLRNISDADVKLGEELKYNGNILAQTIEYVKVDGKDLIKDVDYTVSENTEKDAASYKLKISGKGNYTGTKEVDFSISEASLENVSVSQKSELTYNGNEQTANVTAAAMSKGNQTVTFTYSKTEDGVYGAAVPSFVDADTYTVYFKADADNHSTYKGSFAIKIKEKDVAGADVKLGEELKYNGNILTQTIEYVKVDGKDLIKDADYTVSENTEKDAASYKLKISGKGNYTGTKEVDFSISEASLENVSVSQKSELTYNGNEQTADVTAAAESKGNQSVTFTYSEAKDGVYGLEVPSFKDAGTHKVYYKAAAANHKTEEGYFEVDILKAAVEIKALDKKIYVNGSLPKLNTPEIDKDYVITGLMEGEVLDSKVVVTLAYGESPDISKNGEYNIIPTVSGEDNNYDIHCVNGKLTIASHSSSPGKQPVINNNNDSDDKGSVSVSDKRAESGEEVIITVKPEDGYVLEDLKVTDKNNNEIEVIDKGNGEFSFIMIDGDVDINASFTEDNQINNSFEDVQPQDYYYDPIIWAVKNNITSGTDEQHFSPNKSCSRAEFVTFLWRASGCPKTDYDGMSFVDANKDDYYAEAVCWAVSLEIVKGYDDCIFGTDDCITREQAATILYRYAVSSGMDVSVGENTNILSFNDAKNVSDYAIAAVQWAVGAGIMQGADGNLMPGDECTRAQIVTMMYRMFGE